MRLVPLATKWATYRDVEARSWWLKLLSVRFLFLACWMLLLVGCQQSAPHQEARDTAPLPSVAPTASTAAAPPGQAPTAVDTLLTLQGKRYHLHLQAELDSSRYLRLVDSVVAGKPEPVQGDDGRYTFILRDSVNHVVFTKQLRKATFFSWLGKSVVVPSEAAAPVLLGYSAPLGALVFTLSFVVPETDWGGEVVVLLDLKGRVLRLSRGSDYGGGPESPPTLSCDGRLLLTSSEILRAGQPALSLQKPNAELRGAFLLSDTILFTGYALGHTQLVPTPGGGTVVQFVENGAPSTAPNAFVRHAHTGNVLAQFRYDGYVEELGYTIPRYYVRATHTWYLFDEQQGLYRLGPGVEEVPRPLLFTAMKRFVAPQRPTEVRFEQQGALKQYAFYVDTLAPDQVRYQLLSGDE